MAPTRYIHIGAPKAASTALQTGFFSVHPQIRHLGLGHGGSHIAYVDDSVAIACELGLRFARDLSYDVEVTKLAFETHFRDAAKDTSVRAVGISLEFLSFTFQNEIDITTKARRLRDLFGEAAEILFVVREQRSLLTSLFIELVKGGYPGTFSDFLSYTYFFQDRNWCLEFCFDRVMDIYVELFGPERVHVLPFELIRNDSKTALSHICRVLGVEPPSNTLPTANSRPHSLGVLESIRRINGQFPHEYGSAFFKPFNCGRLRAHFLRTHGCAVPYDRFQDDVVRLSVAHGAATLERVRPGAELDVAFPAELDEWLMRLYGPSNARLAAKTGWPLASLGYCVR